MIGRSPLLAPGWRYIETVALEAFSPAEWSLLNTQRRDYMAAEQAQGELPVGDLVQADGQQPGEPRLRSAPEHLLRRCLTTTQMTMGIDQVRRYL